jgi:hypothetical protein
MRQYDTTHLMPETLSDYESLSEWPDDEEEA